MSTTDTFTATSTWTCPAYVTRVWARCWAGGGSGGGINVAAVFVSVASGGAAGGSFAETLAYPVVPGTVYTVTVAGPTSGSTGSGAAGGDTWFDNNTTGPLAKGGAGGVTPPNGGSAGNRGVGSTTGCIGDNMYAGGSGGVGTPVSTTVLGGGGGGAGSGAPGTTASGASGGGGGATLGGAGGTPPSTPAAGGNGSTYGGGGAGAFADTVSFSFVGGTGAAGRLELEYTPTYTPAGGGIRAVSDTPIDVTSAPSIIDTLAPVSGDVFLVVGNGTDGLTSRTDNGLFEWTSAGAPMTLMTTDPDGSYRDVREGTHAGARVFWTSGVFVGVPSPVIAVHAPDPIVPSGNSYFVNPDAPWWIVKAHPGPEGYVGVLPTVAGGGSCVVTHNLGSRFLLVAIAATAAPYAFVKLGGADWVVERTDLNTVTVRPPSAITAGDFELLLKKAA